MRASLRTIQSLVFLAAWGLGAGSGQAIEAATPLVTQAKLLFKVASYDSNLPRGTLQIGVVHPAADASAGSAVIAAFTELAALKVNGRSFTTVDLPYRSPTEFAGLAQKGFYAFFVTASTPDKLVAELRSVARANHVFTFGQKPNHAELGLCASVEETEQRRSIVLNIGSCVEAGRKFESAFLDACKVIRD